MVSDVVEPCGGDGVEHEIPRIIDEILLDNDSGRFRDRLHVRVAVGGISAFASFVHEFGQEVPSGFNGGFTARGSRGPARGVVVVLKVGAGEILDVGGHCRSFVRLIGCFTADST